MTDQPGEPKGIPTSLESFLYLLREIEVAVERDALQWDAELLARPRATLGATPIPTGAGCVKRNNRRLHGCAVSAFSVITTTWTD